MVSRLDEAYANFQRRNATLAQTSNAYSSRGEQRRSDGRLSNCIASGTCGVVSLHHVDGDEMCQCDPCVEARMQERFARTDGDSGPLDEAYANHQRRNANAWKKSNAYDVSVVFSERGSRVPQDLLGFSQDAALDLIARCNRNDRRFLPLWRAAETRITVRAALDVRMAEL